MHYNYLNIQYDKKALTDFVTNSTDIVWEVLSEETDYCIGTPKQFPSVLKDIMDQLPKIKSSPVFFKNAPQRPHIDRTRSSAVNIPLNIASRFFVAKEYPSEWFEEHIEYKDPIDVASAGKRRTDQIRIFPAWHKHQELYDVNYSIDRPYLLDVSVPHGAINNTDFDRYIMTIGYGSSFEQMKQLLSDKLIGDPYADLA